MNTSGNLSMEVLKARYLLKDAQGQVSETPEQLYWRVANHVASVESRYHTPEQVLSVLSEIFYQMMVEGKFLPNSPTLMNAGRPNGLLSACCVLPINDSIPEIFDAIKTTALIQKAGGGTGFAFDRLRPTGDRVASSGGMTSGPISFWKVFAETTNAIQQGAHRRGANMGMMSIEHPDILKFIHAKEEKEAFTNFNISIKITDEFMKAVCENPSKPHLVINPRTQKHYMIPKTVNVKTYKIGDLVDTGSGPENCYTVGQLWEMIVRNAHSTGEPGLCFIDRVNQDNPTPALGKIEATNPCGEQPLLDYEICNLGSLNLSKFVLPDGSDVDWKELAMKIGNAIRFLDNVIDVNCWPTPDIERISLGNRKIGLGVMGFADALILLGIQYDSPEAVEFAQIISQFINKHAHQQSQELAEKRGCFPNWQGSLWDTRHHRPMRNAACTTIAPTGSISIIAECSSGIEPVFNFVYKRRALDGEEFLQIHPLLEKLGLQQGWLDEKVKTQLFAGESIYEIPQIPKHFLDYLVTAHEVSPDWHVRIQAAFQENVDNAVSKTVNLSQDTNIDEVDKTFRYAYQLGCKGITVYRDSSRAEQILSSAILPNKEDYASLEPRPRIRITTGKTSKFRMGCGTLFVTVNEDRQGLCEVFANLGKAGGCPAQSEATCRIVSAALRCGVPPEVLIEQLRNIRCLSTIARRKDNKNIDVLSCPDAIARALEETMGKDCVSPQVTFIHKCPDCRSILRRDSGCNVCDNCGYSKCG